MARQEGEALPTPHLDRPARVLVVVAPFYREIADHLLAGAAAVLDAAGVAHETVEVPGALEIPTCIALAAEAGAYDGYVALGCVIRGETTHYEIVANESSRGITLLGLGGICVGNGIITVENPAQALVRARPDELDKGGGAAQAVLHLIAFARRFAPDGAPQEGAA